MTTRSDSLFSRAFNVIPGGVNSPVRAFRAVGGHPRFIASAQGCWMQDVDGNRFVDYVGSWGPMILGHAHPEVIDAIQRAAVGGTSFGAPTELEVLLAEKICRLVPSIEKVRLVSSGTEATMSALRLARAFTGRSMVMKFDGCYHGHADSFLVQAGSGVATLGLPDTPGVPASFTEQTLSVPFNNLQAVEEAFARFEGRIAVVICEPVVGNMGVIPPHDGFLAGLIRIAHQHGSLVIFDEVMTGFRLALGGAQELFHLSPDLTTLGKIVGGGLPLGAFGGRREIMSMVAPEGPVYQAGTLSGNPLAVTAGLKTLELLEHEPPYQKLDDTTAAICRGIEQAAGKASIPVRVQRCGSMFTAFFQEGEAVDFNSAKKSNTSAFGEFFRGLLENGVYFAPSQFEACFVSAAHDDRAVAHTIDAVERSLQRRPR